MTPVFTVEKGQQFNYMEFPVGTLVCYQEEKVYALIVEKDNKHLTVIYLNIRPLKKIPISVFQLENMTAVTKMTIFFPETQSLP